MAVSPEILNMIYTAYLPEMKKKPRCREQIDELMAATPKAHIIDLSEGAQIVLITDVFPNITKGSWWDLPCEIEPKFKLYGKDATMHRNIGFFSDVSIGYKFSGQMAASKPLTPDLHDIMERVNELTREYRAKGSEEYNSILVNCYLDGTKYIGAHSDDEKALAGDCVAALSFGATRKFRIREKLSKTIIQDVSLPGGSIIMMVGRNFQKLYTHEIPVEKKIKNARLSLTFRHHTR
jgi:alkylated DNA repair dioxygenase AlkB